MTQQRQDGDVWVIAYPYDKKFYITAEQARKISDAVEQGSTFVKLGGRMFRTNFSWIAPVEEVEFNPRLLHLLRKLKKETNFELANRIEMQLRAWYSDEVDRARDFIEGKGEWAMLQSGGLPRMIDSGA